MIIVHELCSLGPFFSFFVCSILEIEQGKKSPRKMTVSFCLNVVWGKKLSRGRKSIDTAKCKY